MEENTEEEYDDAFQLGCAAKMIEKCLKFWSDPVKSLVLACAKMKYFRLQGLAGRLGIELPDQLHEEITVADERKQFFSDQLDYVELRIRRQSQYNIDMFCTGKSVESYIHYIMLHKRGDEVSPGVDFREHLEYHQDMLQATASRMGIDISEEMDKVNAWLGSTLENHNEFELLIRSQLQKKLGKGKQPEKKRSAIDPTRMISKDFWAVSLVRLPDRSNSEHAFLVIEGTSDNASVIWLADFVTENELDTVSPGIKNGKVRIAQCKSTQEPGASNKLLFQCEKQLMDI